MDLFKVSKKIIIILTVFLFSFSISFNIFAYSPNDLIHDDTFYLPPLPSTSEEPYSIVFTMKEGTGDIYCYNFADVSNIYFYYGRMSYKYYFYNLTGVKYSIYKLTENFDWELVSSSSFSSNNNLFLNVYVSKYDTYGMYFLNVYYINFNLYYYDVLIESPSTLSYPVEFVNSYDDIFYEPVPEGWFDEIMNSVASFVGGLLEGLVAPLQAIGNALNNMWDAIKNIPSKISDVIKDLFVPSDDIFDDFKLKFDTKFGFVGQIIDLGESFLNSIFGSTKPETNITLYGTSVTIIDWDIYDNYRIYIHGIIVLLSYIIFIPKLIKRLPSVIRGI